MSKTRVARISTFLDFGGLEKRFENIALDSDQRIENIFISIGHGGQAEKNIKQSGKEVHCLEYSHKIPSIGTIIKLSRRLKALKVDVVHTSGAEANFHGILGAYLAGVKVKIAEEIGYPHHGKLARTMFRFVYKLSDRVLVNSKGVKKRLLELNEASEHKLQVIYNPCIFPENKKEYLDSETVTFITVSRLTKVKNLDLFIRVFKKLSDQEPGKYRLKVVGDGEEMVPLQNLVERLQIQNVVTFEGFSNKPENHLLKSDVFVLPSLTEGFPNALIEAMALGLNCVATKVGGASDVIEHGENGWLIDPNSEEDIYRCLDIASTLSVEGKRAMGDKARTHVRSRFSLDKHMEALHSLYNENLK